MRGPYRATDEPAIVDGTVHGRDGAGTSARLMTLLRLSPRVRFKLSYQDDTPFGSAVGDGIEGRLHRAASEISEHRRAQGMAAVVHASRSLLEALFAGPLSPLLSAPEKLREECLFPAASAVRPLAISAALDGKTVATVALGENAGELASWVGDMARGTARPEASFGRTLFDALEAGGVLVGQVEEPSSPPPSDAVFVGHATAAFGRGPRVLVDPFVFPKSADDLASYQPLRIADLSPIDHVMVTHSHPDHFDPATLLWLGADVPIVVPHVERESLLSVDMGRRLEELGFRRVRRVRPGDVVETAEGHVDVLPFFGEQPTTGDVLHPDVRNVGCTYVLATLGGAHRTWVVADSGRDRDGDVRDLAGEVGARWGGIDLLLGGYRGFAIYPIHYLFSSVARFLLFVPRRQWATRQQCMNDASALLDTAEQCNARAVLPYADGGAPWHWRIGLGPRLDGHEGAATHPSVDPPPDVVADAARERSSSLEGPIPSPVPVVIVRPGEALSFEDRGLRITRGPHQTWPFRSRTWLQLNVALVRSAGSALASARALFRALEDAVDPWRADGRVSSFHFMRKPPDVRLRFQTTGDVRSEIERLLDVLVRGGVVERWFESVYEPETARFGGVAARDAVNRWFDADTWMWMRLDRLRAAGGAKLAPPALCAAVAHDLVLSAVDGRAEAWDLWRSYADGLDAPATALASLDHLPDLDALVQRASAEEAAVLRDYRVANQRLAGAVRGLWSRGTLTAGLRSVVATVVLFHFHRHGLSSQLHGEISHSMARLLAPAPR